MFALFAVAAATTLPGLPHIPLERVGAGLQLGAELPAALADAGVEPGWTLTAVDDLKLADGEAALRKAVADGPARDVRLRFTLPDGSETILVARRQPLIAVEPVATLPWPAGFDAPATPAAGPRGEVAWTDADGELFTLRDGALAPLAGPAGPAPTLTPLFWELSDAAWVIVGDGAEWGPRSWAEPQLSGAARVGRFGDNPGDHLARAGASGVEVWSVRWPRGTPTLPVCDPRVPETCLTSGRQILAELGAKPGARAEALRHLDVACLGGVTRGCFEAEATETAELRAAATACVDDASASACLTVAADRATRDGAAPSARQLGMLEFACEVDGSGSLGERLRKLEDVGEGCARLAAAHDLAQAPDQALLALDRACVLGRSDACEAAQSRRDAAFAAKTVRECESTSAPIAPSCVELGQLLQQKPVATATLDDFGAFLRGCSLGAATGCQALGDYVDRWGITNPRVVAAEQQLLGACEAGELLACMGAGFLLERHDPRSPAYADALVRFDRACDGRIPDACVAAARQRRIGSARKLDAPDPMAHWSAACALNSAPGCWGLAERQAKSPTSHALAFTHYTRACDLGAAEACTDLGRFVGDTRHEPAWDGEQPASTYLQRGCDNGDPRGCTWLAELSLPAAGEPSERDYLLLERACDGRDGDGCARLAQVHVDRKTNFDDEIAARNYGVACENGNYESCKSLGQMYVRGKGVERDLAKAKELRSRFQLNASRKYLRLGAAIGIPLGAGGELELVAPIPVGPAISVAGQASYVPAAGSVLVILDGDSVEGVAKPALQALGGMLRIYPNNKARGLYVGGGFHTLAAEGGDPSAPRRRNGGSAVVGLRSDSRFGYVGLETGLAQFGLIYTSNFDDDHTGAPTGPIPLILPAMTLSFGLAPF